MKIIGSGAAELIPAPFCTCSVCEGAREKGGKEVRSRSSFRIDEKTQIDMGPDIFYQTLILKNNVYDLENLLITHTHADHFSLSELFSRRNANNLNKDVLNIYMHKYAYEWFKEAGKIYMGNDRFNIIPLEYQREYAVDNLKVIPLKGNHMGEGENEYSSNYLITLEDGKVLYYALDTGYFLEETFEYLKGVTLDYLIIEGTVGASLTHPLRPDGHLSGRSVVEVSKRLYSQGTLNDYSKIYLTHINHGTGHEKLVDFMKSFDVPYEIIVGYDGMEIF